MTQGRALWRQERSRQLQPRSPASTPPYARGASWPYVRSRRVTGPTAEADGLSALLPAATSQHSTRCRQRRRPYPSGSSDVLAQNRRVHRAPRASRCLQGEREALRWCASCAPVRDETSGLLKTPMDFHGLSAAVRRLRTAAWKQGSFTGTRLLGGGGGIRTLERPVTSNGFRDRYKYAYLQGLLCWCASLCASNSQVMHRGGS
jgi:hypothetical protein